MLCATDRSRGHFSLPSLHRCDCGLQPLIDPSVILRIQQCLRENFIHFPQAGAARAPGQHHERDQLAS